MSDLSGSPEVGTNKFIITAIILAFLIILVRTAWLCDDAYISFRVTENFVNGHGLVWNAGERVQAFTHPLWVLILSVLYSFTQEIYFTSIILSILLTLLTVGIIGFRISSSLGSAILSLLILLISKSFIDYATSGLENPLTFLLLTVFYQQFFSRKISLVTFFVLSFVAALAAFNRLDTLLLFLPTLVYAYGKVPKKMGALVGFISFLPLTFWLLFSIFYYGFVLPNTYYAKLHAGVASSDLMVQGLVYFVDSFKNDPLTLLTIVVSLILAFKSKDWKIFVTGLGIILYLGYVVKIGGDFMSGRFFAAPLLGSVILLARRPIHLTVKKYWSLLVLIFAVGVIQPDSNILSGDKFAKDRQWDVPKSGIANQRALFYQSTGLLLSKQNRGLPNSPWYRRGLEWRDGNEKVKVAGAIGFTGFAAGPNVHIVDQNALADPLLARLPAYLKKHWRIGHFIRLLPKGYVETLQSSYNVLADSNLAEYYDKLGVLTTGDIFDWQRLMEIWKFNRGEYDHLLESYLASMILEVNYSDINSPKPPGTMWKAGGTYEINELGIRIHLPQVEHQEFLEASIDNNDRYKVKFINGTVPGAECTIEDKLIPSGGLRVDTLAVPETAIENGYNAIEIYPVSGDDCYSVGHVRLFSLEKTGQLERNNGKVK